MVVQVANSTIHLIRILQVMLVDQVVVVQLVNFLQVYRSVLLHHLNPLKEILVDLPMDMQPLSQIQVTMLEVVAEEEVQVVQVVMLEVSHLLHLLLALQVVMVVLGHHFLHLHHLILREMFRIFLLLHYLLSDQLDCMVEEVEVDLHRDQDMDNLDYQVQVVEAVDIHITMV
mgnify:CR=1 FL=1